MRFFFVLILSLLINFDAQAAGSDDDKTSVKPRDYKKAVNLIKKQNYQEALPILESILSKSKYQKDPDILNEYAFTLRKTGNFTKAEEHYNKALKIDPKHKGALEYLGELYVDTKRIDEAKKILVKLEKCKCNEFAELKDYINKSN